MPIIAKDNGREFAKPDTGLQQAVCSHVVDLGLQPTAYGDKHQVAVCFELAQKMDDGRPFMQTKIYSLTLNEKSALSKDLESWRNKKFTPEEREGFDIEKLIGVNCMLTLVEENRNDKSYVNISAVSPLMKGLNNIAPIGQDLPQWLADKKAAGTPVGDLPEIDVNADIAEKFADASLDAQEDDLPF